ncbi:MAG: efflux RND transporter permease subunit, partial [Planctomycetes bacterium]|nr:efflux RND transporter permease subunit [Planctomycetota bacterium]
VMHYNINRVIDVYANVEGTDLGTASGRIEEELEKIEKEGKVPPGYAVLRRGEVKSMEESFKGLGFGLLLASVLVYLVMVVQFRSMLDPLIVMFTIPFGLIGVVWMLLATGTYMSIQSLMGMIMMVGIVVAFSILMIDFANSLMKSGKSSLDAIREAARTRLRPILMTSLAAILGLIPMAIEGGANIPLARAVIGGVFAATLLSLYVVPVLYLLFKGGYKNV